MSPSVISVDPEVMGGIPVFSGTRVPIQTFLEYLKAGDTVEEFLEGFPSVRREQIVALLDELESKIIPRAI